VQAKLYPRNQNKQQKGSIPIEPFTFYGGNYEDRNYDQSQEKHSSHQGNQGACPYWHSARVRQFEYSHQQTRASIGQTALCETDLAHHHLAGRWFF
jgi:hypothetical protein